MEDQNIQENIEDEEIEESEDYEEEQKDIKLQRWNLSLDKEIKLNIGMNIL